MSDLRDLYQEVILDHGKNPRNFHTLDGANHEAEGFNPFCGDKVSLFLRVEDGVIQDIAFQGRGCAISTASTSMMTDAVKGKRLEEVRDLFENFKGMLTSEPGAEQPAERLGKLAVFAGVCEFPVRVKCATLPWHTLKNALEGTADLASTE